MFKDTILNFELELIKKEICANLEHEASLYDYSYLNEYLYKMDIPKNIHFIVINTLIYIYIKRLLPNDNINQLLFKYFLNGDKHLSTFGLLENIPNELIPQLCEELHISFLNSKYEFSKNGFKRVKSKDSLIENGAVYTRSDIAYKIVYKAFSSYTQKRVKLINPINILDFACGTGRFYEQIIKIFRKYFQNISIDDLITTHIFAIDIDPIAINITRLKAISFLENVNISKIESITNNIILRNGLLKNELLFGDNLHIRPTDLKGLVNKGFDIIVSNPPYLVLKPNKNKMSKELIARINEQVQYFRSSGAYKHSIEGMLNLYQLSIEAMLSMLKTDGELGIICPSTLFADISASKLRKYLLLNHKISSIEYFAEKAYLFENVAQATCIFHLTKYGKTENIEVKDNNSNFLISLPLVKEVFPKNFEIPSINHTEWELLSKLSVHKKLKEFSNIRNRRGELDLTLYKPYITKEETPYRLIRGNMLSSQGINDINKEYVIDDFLKRKSDEYIKYDFGRKRLICPQISNIGCTRRLKFIFSESNDILGNSCNYISSDEKTLKKLFIILNSSLMNWRFKITSSNNHINNYEIDELPIIDLDYIDESLSFNSQEEIDKYIYKLYNIKEEEIVFINEENI